MRCLRTLVWLFMSTEGELNFSSVNCREADIHFKLDIFIITCVVLVCVFVLSPPIWVCWRFLPNCEPDKSGSCTLTMLYENTLQLNHTFTSAGVHCLDISVRNDISKLQTSFSLYVKRSSGWPHKHRYLQTNRLLCITKNGGR